MQEIPRFATLGHNLCENDKQTLHDEIYSLILGIFITNGSLQVSKKALGPCKCARFRAMPTYINYSFSYLLKFVSV